jgi:hypothetical protein
MDFIPASASASANAVPLVAILPVAVLAVGFVAYCLFDLYRSEVRYLPKLVWALICVVSMPIGGIVYLVVGKANR